MIKRLLQKVEQFWEGAFYILDMGVRRSASLETCIEEFAILRPIRLPSLAEPALLYSSPLLRQ